LANPQGITEPIELASMLTTAQMIIEGALQRQESRGVHFRKDYPTEREELNQPIWQRK
jgi:succinate dehydrogenase/fumarate reductase flavoprotein subunit